MIGVLPSLSDMPSVAYLNLHDLRENYVLQIGDFQDDFFQDIIRACADRVYKTFEKATFSRIHLYNHRVTCRKLLRVFEVMQRSRYFAEARRVYDLLFELFYIAGCADSSLVVQLLRTTCVLWRMREHVFTSVHFVEEEKVQQMTFLLRQAKKERFDFWGLWTGEKEDVGDGFCPVTAATLRGSSGELRLLLQYGFRKKSGRKCLTDCLLTIATLGLDDDTDDLDIAEESAIDDRMLLVIQTFYAIFICIYVDPECERQTNAAPTRLLYRSLPDPLVTAQEMTAVMTKVLGPKLVDTIRGVCESYEDVFEGLSQCPLTPRSLQQLSRCAIRQALASAWNMPEGVQELLLPLKIKSYLNLDW